MKFIKKINEFFNSEEEIEREDFLSNDEEEGDFYFDEEEGHDEEEGDFSHEEENWGDEDDSSLGDSNIKSFSDFNEVDDCHQCGNCDNCHEDGDFSDEEFDSTVHHLEFYEDEDEDEDENSILGETEFDDEDDSNDDFTVVETFTSFNEKKKMNAGLQAYLDKKAGKKSKKDEEKEKDEEVNEGLLDKAKQAFGIKSKTEKIKTFFGETKKGILSDGLKKSFNDLKEQDDLFPLKKISGMAPNLTKAVVNNDKSSISKITEEEIAKVVLQSITVEFKDNEWEGTGRGAAEGVTGAQGAYKGNIQKK